MTCINRVPETPRVQIGREQGHNTERERNNKGRGGDSKENGAREPWESGRLCHSHSEGSGEEGSGEKRMSGSEGALSDRA